MSTIRKAVTSLPEGNYQVDFMVDDRQLIFPYRTKDPIKIVSGILESANLWLELAEGETLGTLIVQEEFENRVELRVFALTVDEVIVLTVELLEKDYRDIFSAEEVGTEKPIVFKSE